MTDFIEEVKELWFRETQHGWENAVRFERERIIKLLEAMREKRRPWCGATDCIECEQKIGIEKAIALIKGEK